MNSHANLKPGAQIGDWTVVKLLGSGGNGVVWQVASRAGAVGAIKMLARRHAANTARNKRFVHEIEAMRACSDIPGVLPLLDCHVPKSKVDEPAWFVTPYAQPLDQIEHAPDLRDSVRLCSSLAETLVAMHSKGFSHRDIKPANIFLHESRWCLGDLGLVDFQDKTGVTAEGEKLGPMHYLAPEMLNNASEADGRCADVYSLAKLLWKLGTGQGYPLPGVQFADEPALTLSAYVQHERTELLDRLLEAATQLKPDRRISMSEFSRALSLWLVPPELPRGATDVELFKDKIDTLVRPRQARMERLRNANDRAFVAIDRIDAFVTSQFDQIEKELAKTGIDDFWRAPRGKFLAGSKYFVADCRLDARMEEDIPGSNSLRAVLSCEIEYSIQRLKGERYMGFDVDVPMTLTASCSITGESHDGDDWVGTTKEYFRKSEQFVPGLPQETAALVQLFSGLKGCLPGAVERLIKTFEWGVATRGEFTPAKEPR